MDAKVRARVAFSTLSRTTEVVEAVSYWQSYFSLVSLKEFIEIRILVSHKGLED